MGPLPIPYTNTYWEEYRESKTCDDPYQHVLYGYVSVLVCMFRELPQIGARMADEPSVDKWPGLFLTQLVG